MRYVQLTDHNDDETVWLIAAEGHVGAFEKASKIGVPNSFSCAMYFDPAYRPLFEN